MIDVEKLFAKTQEAFDKKNYEYAIDLAKNILEVSPDHAGARQILRVSTVRNYEIKGGVPSGAGAVLSGFIPLVKMVFFSLLGKKHLAAVNNCEAYLAKNPTSIKGRLNLAQALQALNYVDGAIQEYEGILTLQPNHLLSLKALGELYRIKQDIPKAMDYYKKVFNMYPADPDAPRAMKDLAALTTIERAGWSGAKSSRDMVRDKAQAAELERASQSVKTADIGTEIQRLQQLVQQNPDNPQNVVTLKKIGELYLQKKDYQKAQAAYQQALNLSPSDASLSIRMGDIKVMLFDQDISRLQKELATNPVNQAAKTQLDNLKTEKRKFQIEEYRRRVAAHPTDMGLHFQLGVALYNSGQVDESIAEFQQSVRDAKRRVESHKYLGLAFARKGLNDLAIEQYKKALESSALSSEQIKDLRYSLANAYASNNKIEEARTEYKKILEIDFAYKDVAKRLESLK